MVVALSKAKPCQDGAPSNSHRIVSNGAPSCTERIYSAKQASTFLLALRMRYARIAPRATAVLAEEPGQIRRAVLRSAAEVVDAAAGEVAEEQGAVFKVVAALVIVSVLCQRIERIELRAHRGYDA